MKDEIRRMKLGKLRKKSGMRKESIHLFKYLYERIALSFTCFTNKNSLAVKRFSVLLTSSGFVIASVS